MSFPDFLSPKYIEQEVGGKMLRFYPLSLGLSFRLKTTIRPIMQAIAAFFTQDKGLSKQTVERTTQEDVAHTVTTIDGIPADLYEKRIEGRRGQIDEIIDMFFDSSNHLMLAEVILDSLREETIIEKPAGKRWHETKDLQAFVDSMDIVVIRELLGGVLKANGKVFGPLGEQILGELKEMMTDRFEQAKSASDPEPAGSKAPTNIHDFTPIEEENLN